MKTRINNVITGILLILGSTSGVAQENDSKKEKVLPFTTFKTTRINNSHSSETLLKNDLDFRITHRFGDIAGDNGGYHSMFGIDQARDIRIAAEYGLMKNLTIGIGRSKGAGPVNELYDGFLKFRAITQSGSFPFSITYLGSTAFSAMKISSNESSPASFRKATHRIAYFHQILLASRISDRLSIQLMPSYSHRNLVAYDDQNTVFGLGIGGVLKLNKMWGITGEYFLVHNGRRVGGTSERKILNTIPRDPVSVGVEIETGGHVFHINVSNSGGIGGTQYLPYTTSEVSEGQIRLGFTISRLFHL